MAKGALRVRVLGDVSNLQSALGKAGTLVAGFAAAAAAAVGGLVVSSIKRAADFDEAMTQSLAIMGDLSDSMRKDLSDAAREVGKTTRFSATQAAEALYFLASAGLDAEQSIAALPRVAAFATAGNFDLSEATDLLSNAMGALGMASDDATENMQNMTRVSDVLVKANTLADASVEQFASSLARAGGDLRLLGKDAEEGTAALAVFARQGVKGERAGTLLTNTLQGLARNAINNAGAFADLNISVFDSEGNMKNLADVVADMEGAFAGMSAEAQIAALQQLGFNKQQLEGIQRLMGNSEALREFEETLRSAGGTTDDVAQKNLAHLNAKWDILKGKIENVAVTIGLALLPHLERFVDWLNENWPTIERHIENFIGWVQDAGRTTARVMGEIRKIFSGALNIIGGAWDVFAGLFSGDWRRMWTGVQRIFGGAWNIIDGIFSLALGDMWQEFKDWAADVVRGAGRTWDDVRSAAARGLARLSGAVGRGLDNVGGFFLRLPGTIVQALAGLPGSMVRVGGAIIGGLVSGIAGAAGRAAQAAINAVKGAIDSAKRFLGISSPSKVFMDIGEDTMRGLQIGLDSLPPHIDLSQLMEQAEMDARATLNVLGNGNGSGSGGVTMPPPDGGAMQVEVSVAPGTDERLMREIVKALRFEVRTTARGSAEKFFEART